MAADLLDFEEPIGVLLKEIEALGMMPRTDGARGRHRAARGRVGDLRAELFGALTPWQVVQVARHAGRPGTLDYIERLFTDFVELHGDRRFADDPAIVCGLATYSRRAGARPRPSEGPRHQGKISATSATRSPRATARRCASCASPRSSTGRSSSSSTRPRRIPASSPKSAAWPKPSRSTSARWPARRADRRHVCGEGGSGGALGIAIGDRVLMQQFAIYSVIPPKGARRFSGATPTARSRRRRPSKLTAPDLLAGGLVDAIVPEPLGGAHQDPGRSGIAARGRHRGGAGRESAALAPADRLGRRYGKFRSMGRPGSTSSMRRGDAAPRRAAAALMVAVRLGPPRLRRWAGGRAGRELGARPRHRPTAGAARDHGPRRRPPVPEPVPRPAARSVSARGHGRPSIGSSARSPRGRRSPSTATTTSTASRPPSSSAGRWRCWARTSSTSCPSGCGTATASTAGHRTAGRRGRAPDRVGGLRDPRRWTPPSARANSASTSIVTDHHEPDEELPQALAVINPKRRDCAYPDKHLAGVGVALKLVQALCRRAGKDQWLPGFLKLAAIGTLADVVPLVGREPRHREAGARPALARPAQGGAAGAHRGVGLIGQGDRRLSRRVHDRAARERRRAHEHARHRARGCCSPPTTAAGEEARDSRRSSTRRTSAGRRKSADRRRARKIGRARPRRSARAPCSSSPARAGTAASSASSPPSSSTPITGRRSCSSIDGDVAHGSCRSIPAFDMLAALEACADAPGAVRRASVAAGLTMERSRITALPGSAGRLADHRLQPDDLRPRLRIDGQLGFRRITPRLYGRPQTPGAVRRRQPEPIFWTAGAQVADGPRRLKERHLSMSLRHEGVALRGLFWRAAERAAAIEAARAGTGRSVLDRRIPSTARRTGTDSWLTCVPGVVPV